MSEIAEEKPDVV
jgi:Cdc6-like AAA superfamily ATPase